MRFGANQWARDTRIALIGAIRFLFIKARRAPLWQIIVPLIAIAFLAYTIWKNIDGATFPYNRFPIVVGVWLVVGLAITLVFPAGTGLNNLVNSPVNVGATQVGFCQKSNSSATTANCFIFGGSTVNAGDQVTIAINGAVNPATTRPAKRVHTVVNEPHSGPVVAR